MPAYTHPLRTFGDLAAFDLEAVVSCRCGRHGMIDRGSPLFRNREIGSATVRCTTFLPHGRPCTERQVPFSHRRPARGDHVVIKGAP